MITVHARVIGRIQATKNDVGQQKRGIITEITRDVKNKKRFRVSWADGSVAGVFTLNALVMIAYLPLANAANAVPAAAAPPQ